MRVFFMTLFGFAEPPLSPATPLSNTTSSQPVSNTERPQSLRNDRAEKIELPPASGRLYNPKPAMACAKVQELLKAS